MVRIGPLSISFAEKKTATKVNTTEMGGLGQAIFGDFLQTEYLSDLQWPQSLRVYDRMRKSDAQVQAILLALELPIRSTRWFVEPASTDPKDVEIAEFVERNLFKGLMSSWDDVIRRALGFYAFGHSLAEIVYTIGDDRLVHWKDFAERPQTSIEKFTPDPQGRLMEIEQSIGQSVVKIPADKLVVFTHREEGGDPRGISILRPAYKHWFMKDYIYKVVNIGIEQEYVGIPWASVPSDINSDLQSKLEEILSRLTQGEKAWFWLPEEYKINRYQSERDQLNVLPYIEHHDLLIARSVLAQFINMGQSDVGSYALSEDHSNVFLMTLDAHAGAIETVFNRRAIPALVNANWGVTEYPELRHDPVGARDNKQLVDALNSMVSSRIITPDENLEEFMRDFLGLPEPSKPKEPEPPTIPAGNPGPEDDPDPDDLEPDDDAPETEDGLPNNRTFAEPVIWRRPLTKWEHQVSLAELNAAFNSVEFRMKVEGLKALGLIFDPLWPDIQGILRMADVAMLSVLVPNATPLVEAFIEIYFDLVKESAALAAEDLGVPEPVIPDQLHENIAVHAGIMAQSVVEKVLSTIKANAASAIQRQADPEVTFTKLQQQLTTTGGTAIDAQGADQIGAMVNTGRDLVVKSAGINRVQYSAILDQKVCRLCKLLDSKVTTTDDQAYIKYRPPLHHRCRCIWVLIGPDEIAPPPVDWTNPPPDVVDQFGGLVD